MALLNIKDKYLKKLRDNGYLGYSREGDKYWYTQEDIYRFCNASTSQTSPPIPTSPETVRIMDGEGNEYVLKTLLEGSISYLEI